MEFSSVTPNDFLPRMGRVGETPHEIARHIAVFLDGVEQRYVIAYDCNAGTVERYKRNDDQFVTTGPPHDPEIEIETLTGVVTVEWKV